MLRIPQWLQRKYTSCRPAEPVAHGAPADLTPWCSLTGTSHHVPPSPGVPLCPGHALALAGLACTPLDISSARSLLSFRSFCTNSIFSGRQKWPLHFPLSHQDPALHVCLYGQPVPHKGTSCPHIPHCTPSTAHKSGTWRLSVMQLNE